MKIRLSSAATADIVEIDAYYAAKSLEALANVRRDIDELFETLKLFPDSGRDVGSHDDRPVRKSVTSRYRYVVFHRTITT